MAMLWECQLVLCMSAARSPSSFPELWIRHLVCTNRDSLNSMSELMTAWQPAAISPLEKLPTVLLC